MSLRLPRRRVWRVAIYLVSLLLVLIAIDLVLVEWRRSIRPGYFTTRITEPVEPNGAIDYLAALEAYFGAGVTPENNSAALLIQALGRSALPANQPEHGITRRLGIPDVPQDGDYFVDYEDFCRSRSATPEADPTRADQPVTWPAQLSPVTAKWLEANEKPLALIVEASKRPRFFIPYDGGHRTLTLLEIALPHVPKMHDIRRALLTRAMVRLDRGDVAGFREDVLAVYRWARLMAQAPTMIERIQARTALEAPACRTVRAAASSGKLSAGQSRALAADLTALGDLTPFDDGIDICERFLGLHSMQTLARIGPKHASRLLQMVLPSDRPGDRAVAKMLPVIPFPYERSMRRLNQCYDGMLAALRKPTYAQRAAALDQLNAAVDALRQPAPLRQMLSGDWPAALFIPALSNASRHSEVGRMENRLAQVALALSAYKVDNGTYPASLAPLAPAYLPEVPLDLFSGKPLIYARSGEGYTLYSVGPNLRDDGGKSDEPADDVSGGLP